MIQEIFSSAYTYIITVVVMFLIFLILHIKQSMKLNKLMKKYDKFMKGKNAENLDGAIRESFKQIEKINVEHQKTMIKVEESVHRINSVFQKLGIVKYNAFKEMGGNLSFALCMLDKVNNGYIINVMHSNNGCFAYIKEVVDGKSYIELGDEENQALQQAVAGRMGDADLGRKVNDVIQKDVSVD